MHLSMISIIHRVAAVSDRAHTAPGREQRCSNTRAGISLIGAVGSGAACCCRNELFSTIILNQQ